MGHYPFEWQVQDLCAGDFKRFQNQFSQTILQLVPFALGPVTFLDVAIDLVAGLHNLNKPKYWLQYIKQAVRRQRSVAASEKPILFLPVWSAGTIVGIAAVEGVDAQFSGILSEEWLNDRSHVISREFLLQKERAFDPVTGMFNGRHLQDALDSLLIKAQEKNRHVKKRAVRHHVSLLLLEIHPRTNNAEKALNYIINAGYYLESFLGQDVLHHFGNGIFGFIEENVDEDQAKKLGKNIFSWFRREGFQRIHIGINTIEHIGKITENAAANKPLCKALIEQAWQALRKASRRGPYALCTYSSISKPETHPLKKTKSAVLAKLRKLWADADTFVFLKNADVKQALSWARKLKKKLPGDLGTTYSIGIA
jgi:GGDEF domain-containing protein